MFQVFINVTLGNQEYTENNQDAIFPLFKKKKKTTNIY